MKYLLHDIKGRAFVQSAFSAALYATVLVVLALRYMLGLYDYDPVGVLAATGALAILSIVCLWGTRAARSTASVRIVLAIQPLLSLAGVTAIVHFSGGVQSNFIFLYTIPALTAVWVSGIYAVCVAIGSAASLGLLLMGELSGIIPAITKTGYEASQLAAIHISRLIVLMAVVLGASFAYVSYLAKRNRSSIELRDEVIYQFAEELATPLSLVRERIAEGQAANIAELDQSIAEALENAQAIVSRLDAHAPLYAHRNLSIRTHCTACSRAIRLGDMYWSMDMRLAKTDQLGSHRNDIHCAACHTGSGCDICTAYARPATSREALS